MPVDYLLVAEGSYAMSIIQIGIVISSRLQRRKLQNARYIDRLKGNQG